MENALTPPFSLGTVILGAGKSSRMGRPKLLLPWGETSVAGHLIRQWERLGSAQVAVVCAVGDQVLETELDRLGFPAKNRIYNPTPDEGMFSSIQCAARFPGWVATLTHWAIVLGDQPHLRRETLKLLVEFSAARSRCVVQPVRAGHGRHPVILPRPLFLELALSKAATLKEFLSASRGEMAQLAVEDEAFDLDLDHPADYERALRMSFP